MATMSATRSRSNTKEQDVWGGADSETITQKPKTHASPVQSAVLRAQSLCRWRAVTLGHLWQLQHPRATESHPSTTMMPTGSSSATANISAHSLSESEDLDWLHPTALPGALLSQLPYLQHLDCSRMDRLTTIQGLPCTLMTLDLSKCRSLQDLGPLAHCTKLMDLTLSGNYDHWRAMVESLPPVTEALGPSLIHLKIRVSCREPQTWDTAADEALLRCLAPLKGLQELNVALASEDRADWHEFGLILGTMTHLTLLDLSNNRSATRMPALTPGLSKLTGLRHLNLGRHLLYNNATVAAVAHALAQLTVITWLDLSRNVINDAAAVTLAPALLAQSASLGSLVLTFNNIGAEGTAALSPSLQRCTALTMLDLSYNDIGYQGAPALAGTLQAIGPNLTRLGISGNQLTDGGFADLTPSLRRMTAMTSLDCCDNYLTPTSAQVLAIVLSHTTNLRRLCLAYNALGPGGIQELLPAVQALEGLDLYATELGGKGVEVLAEGLGTLTALRRLWLRESDLDAAPIQAAAAALPDLTLTEMLI